MIHLLLAVSMIYLPRYLPLRMSFVYFLYTPFIDCHWWTAKSIILCETCNSPVPWKTPRQPIRVDFSFESSDSFNFDLPLILYVFCINFFNHFMGEIKGKRVNVSLLIGLGFEKCDLNISSGIICWPKKTGQYLCGRIADLNKSQ